MAYAIDFRPSALRRFKKLPADIRRRLSLALDALTREPFPPGVKKLMNEENVYRVRVGDYRILYSVDGQELLILVLRVGHRKEVYR